MTKKLMIELPDHVYDVMDELTYDAETEEKDISVKELAEIYLGQHVLQLMLGGFVEFLDRNGISREDLISTMISPGNGVNETIDKYLSESAIRLMAVGDTGLVSEDALLNLYELLPDDLEQSFGVFQDMKIAAAKLVKGEMK